MSDRLGQAEIAPIFDCRLDACDLDESQVMVEIDVLSHQRVDEQAEFDVTTAARLRRGEVKQSAAVTFALGSGRDGDVWQHERLRTVSEYDTADERALERPLTERSVPGAGVPRGKVPRQAHTADDDTATAWLINSICPKASGRACSTGTAAKPFEKFARFSDYDLIRR